MLKPLALISALLIAGCAPKQSPESCISDKQVFERHQAEVESYLLEAFGKISLENAVRYDFVPPVAAEIERLGTADFRPEWGFSGETVLHTACSWGSEHVVDILLARGADPLIRSNGSLPIHEVWQSIYSARARKAIETGTVPVGEIEKYKRILRRLSIPEAEFAPQSEKADSLVALEIFTHHMGVNSEAKANYYLQVNGRDCPDEVLKTLSKNGFTVHAASNYAVASTNTIPMQLQLDIKWTSDHEAEVQLYIPSLFHQKGVVTYACGFWMYDIFDSEDI